MKKFSDFTNEKVGCNCNVQKTDKKPVKNADLWLLMDTQVQRHEVSWRWVKGHAGDPGNERADLLANRGVEDTRARIGR